MNKIKQFRKKKGLTQAEFAKVLGMSQSHVSKIENGTMPTNYQFLKAMRLVFKFNVNKFLEE